MENIVVGFFVTRGYKWGGGGRERNGRSWVSSSRAGWGNCDRRSWGSHDALDIWELAFQDLGSKKDICD